MVLVFCEIATLLPGGNAVFGAISPIMAQGVATDNRLTER